METMSRELHFEYKMKSTSFCWFANIFLFILIFYNAEVCRIIGLQWQPLAISVVWTSTGFSLASLLLFGLKVSPAIFLGNFCYNFLHLYLNGSTFIGPFFLAAILAFGSLLQALVGNFLMRRFSSPGYFNNARDVFIFLLGGGALTCLIASSIGVAAFHFYQTVPWRAELYTWIVFWVGDSLGVYLITPLLVVWSIQKPMVRIKDHFRELVLICVCAAILTLLSFIWSYPIPHLFIPLIVWIAYTFRMHGATLGILCISLVAIVATSLGYGAFSNQLISNQLFVLVVFLEIIVATALILAAMVNEREVALLLLESNNIDLQQAVNVYMQELKQMDSEVFIKEKLTSLGFLTSGIARQMQNPLKKIDQLTQICEDRLNWLRSAFSACKDKIGSDVVYRFEQQFESFGKDLDKIDKLSEQANRIAKVIEEQSNLTSAGKIKAKSININSLLNICLLQAIAVKKDPDFNFTTIEEFDKTVKMIIALPEDLGHAFIYLFENAIRSMKEKKERLGNTYYEPILKVCTIDDQDKIIIKIQDNGQGIPEYRLTKLFHSFVASEPVEQTASFDLSLAHDIIVHVYHGEIEVDSKEGEYLHITLRIPKPSRTHLLSS